ncbi:hypothetical protein [Tenacibaculum sp. M341]|uniref:hypothetical protein n=1 Tax=Tenacibaculum sp. M341 TaxID=2530339 RepID=UPI001053008C|nr:hypothetical protein [Tenacibaculum sp. M341]TCI95013.1 hypothetical protein EYW44_01440 [Tenacibaculum sp. M341]
MKKLIVLLISIHSIIGIAQQKNMTNNSEPKDEAIFPEKCLGVWEGIMQIYGNNKLLDNVNVKFTVAKTDITGKYVWKTEYLSPKRTIVKDYKLIINDLETGRYVLDEENGIKLMTYNVGDKLYSSFKVKDTHLTASTEFLGDKLIFEVTSGKEISKENDIAGFSVTNVQRVVLRKTK